MISLNGFVFRQRLTSIIGRWIINRQEPSDGRELKRIVNFNAYIGRIILDEFARSFLGSVNGQPVRSSVAATKGQVKDALVANPPYHTARIDELIRRYQRFPEDFYRETPYDGRIYYVDGERFLGSTRIKRFRRIAEKSGRRIIDYMFDQVKWNADALAAERAARLGIPKDRLITPLEEQIAEFQHAERRVLKAIRLGTISDNLPTLNINDVLGLKVVVGPEGMAPLLAILERDARTQIIEREVHRGHYNATNIIVRYAWPRDIVAARPPEGRAKEVLVRRGFEREAIEADYQDFVRTAESELFIELILATYDEALESEIGRCMHEERILSQRANDNYHGSLAKNIEYLMEFMLLFCLSPHTDPGELPFRLWVHYMPDYVDMVFRSLLGFTSENLFTGLL